MKAISVLALAGLAAAQFQGLPSCAQSCANKYLQAGIGNCGTNAKCICADQDFLSGIACCLASDGGCGAADQSSAVTFASQLCAANGVTVPSAVLCASTALASNSATGTAAPASASAASTAAATSATPSATTSATTSAAAAASSTAAAAATTATATTSSTATAATTSSTATTAAATSATSASKAWAPRASVGVAGAGLVGGIVAALALL